MSFQSLWMCYPARWENAIAYSGNKAVQDYHCLSPNEATSQTAFCQQCPKAQYRKYRLVEYALSQTP
ncbi:hypothetical protein H6F98_15775 [Microcoleus sp. FACHB-SPT15]|nr:hypothetical protein [Microcoleus sp. FACHB-SPT15]